MAEKSFIKYVPGLKIINTFKKGKTKKMKSKIIGSLSLRDIGCIYMCDFAVQSQCNLDLCFRNLVAENAMELKNRMHFQKPEIKKSAKTHCKNALQKRAAKSYV
jgi:hypothetical protein